MLKEKVKCVREQRKCQGGEAKDYGGKKEGTSAKEEIQQLGWKIQGADSAKGENKMHDGLNQLSMGNKGLRENK